MRQLFFDAINPYTGRIHTLDDANLFFGADLGEACTCYNDEPEENQQETQQETQQENQ